LSGNKKHQNGTNKKRRILDLRELTKNHKKTASFEAVFVHYSDEISNNLLEDFDKFYDLFEEKNL
jgi:hypothetical protein